MKRILFALTTLLCCASVRMQAQVSPAYAAKLQAVLDSTCSRYHVKGASAAVYVPGSGMWKGVHGDSYSGQPVDASMAFPLNSNTKTYVAALLLKLQEDGALSLSDTIGTWIHNKTNINGQVTVRQLLNHTSGLYSFTDTPAFGDSIEANFSRIWQPDEMLQFVGPPVFAPGTNWDYSNTNYLLAGMIIAKVTGMPVEQALRTKLLAPQNLNHTWYYPLETPTGVIPHFWFYDGAGGIEDGMVSFGYTPEAFYSSASSAGALFATAEDNAMFWHKIISGQIINATSMSQWRQTIRLNSNIGYGLGVFRYQNFNGHLCFEHGGTGAGAINENLVDSVTGVSISVLTNQDSADNDMLLYQVVSALHKVTLNPPTAIYVVAPSPAFSIYPNPVQSRLEFSWQSSGQKGYSYHIVDAAGRTLRFGDLSTGTSSIPVDQLANGMYYLRIAGPGGADATKAFTVLR